MNTYSLTITRTLSYVILATLILAALVMLVPNHSEAAIRVNARIGTLRITTHADPCCTVPVVASRRVVVRSSGRERIVVRNDYPQRSACGGAVAAANHHRYNQVWVPGHYKTKIKRHGRLKTIWIPGHWVRN